MRGALTLTAEEVSEIKRLANSRTASIRLVQQARIIAFMHDDPNLFGSKAGLKAGFTSTITGPKGVKGFKTKGMGSAAAHPLCFYGVFGNKVAMRPGKPGRPG
jgi:hypothetical protein